MFVLRQEKLFELDQAQNQEFLFDLVYEIIKENPALKLNGQFDQLVEPVQCLMNQYLEKGINQINTLKYMVKSHVYLGIDYENDPQFDWIKTEMENYSIEEQVTYVDVFYEILENYKENVIGKNFEFLIDAITQLSSIKEGFKSDILLEDIYPQKVDFFKKNEISIFNNHDNLKDQFFLRMFILGRNFKNNHFINNIYSLEV